MSARFAATFSGPDLVALTRALIDAAPYARGLPHRMTVKLSDKPPVPAWRDEMLAAEVDGLAVEWGEGERIARNPTAVAAGFPALPLEPAQALDELALLPFEIAVLATIRDNWVKDNYFAPSISPDHALLGWGMIVKREGHDSIASRRWLESGPYRVFHGAEDTMLVQFHNLAADGPASIEQARPGHEWIMSGFLRAKHRYKHDIKGVYTKADGLLRIVVNDRVVTDTELLDACAARRDGRDDKDRPIKNVAYVFVDEGAAKENLERLWLRSLEARVVTPSGEQRLDADYQPAIKKPPWVGDS